MPLTIAIPRVSVSILIGASGSGKTSFALRHFKPTEILSSDLLRAWVSDNENDQTATAEAFELLQTMVRIRLHHRRRCVIDSTNIKPEHRAHYIRLAAEAQCPAIAIYLDIEERICIARTQVRTDRDISELVVLEQHRALRQSTLTLSDEGFNPVYTLSGAEQIDTAVVILEP